MSQRNARCRFAFIVSDGVTPKRPANLPTALGARYSDSTRRKNAGYSSVKSARGGIPRNAYALTGSAKFVTKRVMARESAREGGGIGSIVNSADMCIVPEGAIRR